MKALILILLFWILKADTNIDSDKISGLKITMKNSNVFFVDINTEDLMYLDTLKKKKSFNLIELDFKNVSKKKMMLFLDPSTILFFKEKYLFNEQYLVHNFLITKDDEMIRVNNILVSFTDYPKGLDNIEHFNKKRKEEKYKYMGLSNKECNIYDLYENHSLVLDINETRTFFFALHLPIVKEINSDIQQNPLLFDNLEEDLDFKFYYHSLGQDIYDDLPRFVKDELNRNNIEIFDGTVYSNSVKLKKR
jgi:hypothetical protein